MFSNTEYYFSKIYLHFQGSYPQGNLIVIYVYTIVAINQHGYS